MDVGFIFFLVHIGGNGRENGNSGRGRRERKKRISLGSWPPQALVLLDM
jgi:hypothetical protein